MTAAQSFDEAGFLISEPLLDADACDMLTGELAGIVPGLAGTRSLLALPWCRQLAAQLQAHPVLAALLPATAMPVLCTLFEKSRERNWLVPLHQDLSIPVAKRVEHQELHVWSVKEGGHYVQPPAAVLAQLLAVRLHVDDCGPGDGALRVVPGSHGQGRLDAAALARLRGHEVLCPVKRGAVLTMRPLLAHGSAKSAGNSRRRVLHFLFGPPVLPFGLGWPQYGEGEVDIDVPPQTSSAATFAALQETYTFTTSNGLILT